MMLMRSSDPDRTHYSAALFALTAASHASELRPPGQAGSCGPRMSAPSRRTCGFGSPARSPFRTGAQASSSTSAVSSPPASPVLMTVPGSNRSTAVSVSARGQCSTPRGTTKSSRGASTTLRSRI